MSKFTLFVVTLKSKNVTAPPTLSNAVEVISNHASQLAGLANTLASGYAEYATIQSKILSEAAGLSSAEKNLMSTCRSLSGSAGSVELASGWEKLNNACRAIATAVINLLEILYKAEVERIYITNERLQSAGDAALEFPVVNIDSNQQAFADTASDSATYASHLAQFLLQRAQGEESPAHKAELETTANLLANKAQDIVNQANECMDEPNDEQRHQAYHNMNKDVLHEGNKIVQRITEIEEERNRARLPPPPEPESAPTPQPVVMEAPKQPSQIVSKPTPVVMQKAPEVLSHAKPSVIQSKPKSRGRPAPKPQKLTNMNQVVDLAKDLAKQNEVRNCHWMYIVC